MRDTLTGFKVGMNVRLNPTQQNPPLQWKIIGRDPQIRSRFTIGRLKDEDGYRIICHHVHYTDLRPYNRKGTPNGLV